jgi:Zn-dependent peptidase ImmA (M78 family)
MRKPIEAARKLLAELKIKDIPVPVERIAEKLGAKLSFEPFEGELSGMLFRKGDRIVIGVNSSHAHTRQRFTIAHELAHLQLHEGELYVDEGRINLRDEDSSLAIKPEEIEANAFAAELLMPEDFICNQFSTFVKRHRDSPEDLIVRLAKMFDVSSKAMEYRLSNLGLLTPT